jgi:hypothetical protein
MIKASMIDVLPSLLCMALSGQVWRNNETIDEGERFTGKVLKNAKVLHFCVRIEKMNDKDCAHTMSFHISRSALQ